jgi:hypothetical protein
MFKWRKNSYLEGTKLKQSNFLIIAECVKAKDTSFDDNDETDDFDTSINISVV